MNLSQEIRYIDNKIQGTFRFISFLVVLMAIYGLGLTLGAYNTGNVYKERLSALQAVQRDTLNSPCTNPKKPTIPKLELL